MMDRPILMSAPMVRALLERRKTQTRRIIKKWHGEDGINLAFSGLSASEVSPGFWKLSSRAEGGCWNERVAAISPYEPGDRLHVKEATWMWCEKRPNGKTKAGRPAWSYVPLVAAPIFYAADGHKPSTHVVSPETGNAWGWHFKVGRFMPRWASRFTLEATEVRVQRLQEISEEDAIAEAVQWHGHGMTNGRANARGAYMDLWESINGAGSWEANPWVWVISFKEVA